MRFLVFLVFLGLASPAAFAQTIKVGDNLSISVMQDSKLDRTVVVDPSGQIAFPLAGHFRVSGLTPQARGKYPQREAEEQLQGREPGRHGFAVGGQRCPGRRPET